MMKQFQQCYLSMAQMFAAMQQEHTALVSEQMRQIQEMADELRELRAEARHNGTSPPAPQGAAPGATANEPSIPKPAPQPRIPTMKVPPGPEGKALADAHKWFMDRLANKGQPPAGS
jgi:hypothetical protein